MRSLIFTLSVLVLVAGGRVVHADPSKPTYDSVCDSERRIGRWKVTFGIAMGEKM